jgi:hypothetical protein
MNLCHRHETQFRYCGELKELTRKDKNNINIFGKIAKIILRNNKFDVVGEAIIDSEDVCRVKDLKWSLHRGYAVNNKIKHVALHQVIFGMKNSPQIDHINRNKLDNRKKNLREATFRLNIINRDVQLNNKSTGVKGISKREDNKFRARIFANGKSVHLGYFKTIREAERVRKQAERKYFGEFAVK